MSTKRKILSRIGLGAGTLGAILALAAAFSAFESHIINVTARIENALNVPTEALAFGTVFPQEYLTRDIQVGLSDSFLSEGRVDDVTYTIKQKPKVKDPICAQQVTASSTDPCNDNPIPGDPYSTITVGAFTGPAWQYCENNLPPDSDTTDTIGYTVDLADPYWQHCYLPLANSLSKDKALDEQDNNIPTDAADVDVQVPAFHQAYVWASGTNVSSLDPAFLAHGKLIKSGNDTEDTWVIDLKVPCFHNMCAQEASDPTNDVNDDTPGFFVPDAFRLDPKTEHKVFGTDLWIEVTGVSLPGTPPPNPATLTVNKVVINDNGGTATTTDFGFMVDGGSLIPFEADGSNTMNATSGPHTVTEPAVAGYTATFSDGCNLTGDVTVPASGNVTCTITNNDNPPEVGHVVVNKVVVNDNGGTATTSNFNLLVNATSVTSGSTNDFAAGTYTVSESGLFGYSATFSDGCDSAGSITVVANATTTCTITNNDIAPSITLVKSVVGGSATTSDFTLTLDGSAKASGSSSQVSANAAHTINEVVFPGYSFTSITGSSFLGVPCPAVLAGTITLAPGDAVICTITNTANP